jgi:hypothetical protein
MKRILVVAAVLVTVGNTTLYIYAIDPDKKERSSNGHSHSHDSPHNNRGGSSPRDIRVTRDMNGNWHAELHYTGNRENNRETRENNREMRDKDPRTHESRSNSGAVGAANQRATEPTAANTDASKMKRNPALAEMFTSRPGPAVLERGQAGLTGMFSPRPSSLSPSGGKLRELGQLGMEKLGEKTKEELIKKTAEWMGLSKEQSEILAGCSSPADLWGCLLVAAIECVPAGDPLLEDMRLAEARNSAAVELLSHLLPLYEKQLANLSSPGREGTNAADKVSVMDKLLDATIDTLRTTSWSSDFHSREQQLLTFR